MLDEEAINRFFQQMHKLWIEPELNRRFGKSGIPSDFRIWECLIKHPKNQSPIVEFNDEIEWEVELEVAPNVNVKAEQWVYAHEVVNLRKVSPPKVDGKRVAFIYLYWAGYSYSISFDANPNWDDFDEDQDEFRLEPSIINHLKLVMNERIVKAAQIYAPQLQQIGLWTATSLLPYPISKLVERIGENDLEGARSILIEHCNSEFIERKLLNTWKHIECFNSRFALFQEALFAHQHKRYIAAIHTLIPQVEGVITDWLYQNSLGEKIKWKTESKIDQFHQIMQKIPQFEYVWKQTLDSTHSFLRHAQPMQSFTDWLAEIDPAFPGRHPVTHGKYTKEMYSEENSIKLFLLLDTICQFMMFYEARVLGRDFEDEG